MPFLIESYTVKLDQIRMFCASYRIVLACLPRLRREIVDGIGSIPE